MFAQCHMPLVIEMVFSLIEDHQSSSLVTHGRASSAIPRTTRFRQLPSHTGFSTVAAEAAGTPRARTAHGTDQRRGSAGGRGEWRSGEDRATGGEGDSHQGADAEVYLLRSMV